MAVSTHLFNIIFQVIDKATKSLGNIETHTKRLGNTLTRPLKSITSMTDAIEDSMARHTSWNKVWEKSVSLHKSPSLRLAVPTITSISDAVEHSSAQFVDYTEQIRKSAMAQMGFKKTSPDKMIDNFIKKQKAMDNALQQSSKTFGGFNKRLLGIGLGMTFFMWGIQMQLKRMMRSMFNIWEQAQGETGGLIEKFNIMRASLGAISIAFWDAFAQSALFEGLLNVVQKAADWFLNLSDATREWITGFVGETFVITMGISFLGQLALGINTLLGFFGDVKGGWVKTMAGVGTVITIGLAVTSIKDFLENKIMKGIIDTTATIISAFGVAGLVKGVPGAGYLFAIAIGLNLIGQGIFFTTLSTFIGILVGIIGGLGEYMVKIIVWNAKKAWNEAISSLPIPNILKKLIPAFNVGAMPDFTDIMKEGVISSIMSTRETGGKIDETINKWIAEADARLNKPQHVVIDNVNAFTSMYQSKEGGYAGYVYAPFG